MKIKKQENWDIIEENRAQFKYKLSDIKLIVIKCCETDKPADFNKIHEEFPHISVRHIKIINYILKYGMWESIRLLFIPDDKNEEKMKYMLARIKTKIKNIDRKVQKNKTNKHSDLLSKLKWGLYI